MVAGSGDAWLQLRQVSTLVAFAILEELSGTLKRVRAVVLLSACNSRELITGSKLQTTPHTHRSLLSSSSGPSNQVRSGTVGSADEGVGCSPDTNKDSKPRCQ